MKRGAILEDRERATEGRIRAHVQAMRGQSESAEKRYEDVVDKLHPSLSLHFATMCVSSIAKLVRNTS